MPFDLARYQLHRRPGRIGAEVRYLEVTGSTMDDARAGADGGAPCGTAYVAGEQTAGRGRQQRRWVAARESGLYVTFHLCPEAALRPWLAVAGALATADALQDTAGLAADLKWPNDVLYDGRKLAGVLAESRLRREAADVFLGIGINLRPNPAMPPEVAALATSVQQAGATPPVREELLAALAAHLERWTGRGAVAIREAWRQRLVTLGTRVRLASPAADAEHRVEFEGIAVDVDANGDLVLELAGGERRPFSAGDVTTLR